MHFQKITVLKSSNNLQRNVFSQIYVSENSRVKNFAELVHYGRGREG